MSAVCLRLMSLSGLHEEETLSRVPMELALLPRRLRGKLSFTVPGVMSWGVMDARLRPAGGLRGRARTGWPSGGRWPTWTNWSTSRAWTAASRSRR